jgi:hypothetical protein
MSIERSSWYEDIQGVIRWVSNNNVPPADCLEWLNKNGFINYPRVIRSTKFREDETARAIEDYKERMKNHVPDEEELFEMRSAFGEGATVVNVITGKRTKI